MEPVDNKEYMAQMAQFTSVEQLSNIAESIESTNELNSLISVQLEDLKASIEGNASNEQSAKLLEQNTKILEELMKMNQTLSTYFNKEETVEDQELYDLLDSL